MVSNWDYQIGFNLAIKYFTDDIYGKCERPSLPDSEENNPHFIYKIAIMLKLTGDYIDIFFGCESIKRKIEICRENYIEIPDKIQKLFDERTETIQAMSYFFSKDFFPYLGKNFILPKLLGSYYGNFNSTVSFYFLVNDYFKFFLNLERTRDGSLIYKGKRFTYKAELSDEVKKDLEALTLNLNII